MSQWIHVRGGFEIYGSPFEAKTAKDGEKELYLPYPEEQVEINAPLISRSYKDGKDDGPMLEFRVYIRSLPRMRKYIDKAMSMLPQGEDKIHYSVYQDPGAARTSSSDFTAECEEKAFKNAVTKMYQSPDPWNSYDYKELSSIHKVGVSWVDYNTSATICIRNDIRYASGMEFMEALESAIAYLGAHGIGIEDGYLEWEDEYEERWIYAWRCSRISPEEAHCFMILDKKTNAAVWKRKYFLKPDCFETEAYEYDVQEEGELPKPECDD